jgi:hypothetical protein
MKILDDFGFDVRIPKMRENCKTDNLRDGYIPKCQSWREENFMEREKMGKWKKQKDLNIWQPTNPEDELVGEVISITESRFGGYQYCIKQDDESMIITPSHKVLQNRIIDAKVGTRVKIVFIGYEKPTTKGYSPMAMYDVFFEE